MHPISFGPATYMPVPTPVDPRAAAQARDEAAPRLGARLMALGRLAWRSGTGATREDRDGGPAGDARS